MKVFQCTYDFSDIEVKCFPRVYDGVHVPYLCQQLSTLKILHHEEEILIILEGGFHLDNEMVIILPNHH